eukprot:3049102-Rhodomonas_salina.1
MDLACVHGRAWHLHKLDPVSYNSDCKQAFGIVLGPPPNVSLFHFASEPDDRRARFPCAAPKLSISSDIICLAEQQATFLWQVRGLQYDDTWFLEAAVHWYNMMLGLMKKYPKVFIVQTYNMDLMWHTHLAYLQHYSVDCLKVVGSIVDHDDSDSDRKQAASQQQNLCGLGCRGPGLLQRNSQAVPAIHDGSGRLGGDYKAHDMVENARA